MAAARGGIERVVLEEMVAQGATIAEISVALDRSKATVRYWLARYGLRTQNRIGPRPSPSAPFTSDAGSDVRRICAYHGETEFVFEARGAHRCKQCRLEAVSRRRRAVKAILVAEAGGRCCICGYDRNQAVLQFHHRDPSQKRMGLSSRGVALSLDTLRAEARKCVLLCANCHAEVEAGVTVLPIK